MITEIYQQIVVFLKNPKNTSLKENRKDLKKIVIQFIVFDFFLFAAFGVLSTFLLIIFEDYKAIFNSRNIPVNSFLDSVLIVVLVAPILEELAFRLGLKINKLNIAITIGIQLIIFLKIFQVINYSLLLRFISMLICSVILYFIINRNILSFFKSKQNIFIYYNIIVFGLLHAFNYSYQEFSHYLFIPFLVSVQLILGVYLSFVRIKYGFILCLLMHISHNSILFFLKLTLH